MAEQTGYGIMRGLNEAYGSFRAREREYEDKSRRALVDERLLAEGERQEEEYQYGITQRGRQERAADVAIEGAELGLKQSKGTYNEWVANTANRATLNKQALEKAKLDLKASGLNLDDAEITLKAKKGAAKYNEWTRDWLQGGTMEDVIQKFNNDDDDTNNIKTVTGSEEKGWDVVMENGREIRFDDRDQVAIHLQSMADPNFHQTYLLQMESQKASLAAAIQKAGKKSVDQTSKDKNTWENMSVKQVDRYFTESIKESIVSLGSEGQRKLAGDVRAVVDSIGAASGYTMVNSDVVRVANSMAETMLVKDPGDRKRMAEEFLQSKRDAGESIPEEGDDGYEIIIERQMAEDYDRAYDQYKRAVYTKFFKQDKDGNLSARDYQQVADAARAADPDRDKAGDTITTAGLDRPGTPDKLAEEGGSTSAPVMIEDTGISTSQAAASEDVNIVAPTGLDLSQRGSPQMGGDAFPNATKAEASYKLGLENSLTAMRESNNKSKKEKAARQYGIDRGRLIGVNSRADWKAADKAKIKDDYTRNFATMDNIEQKAWLKTFARGLDSATKKIARGIAEGRGRKLASN
jgi:hypothetical protein